MITLNVKKLNSLIKRHKVVEWIEKLYSTICCLQDTHFRAKGTHRLKVRKWKKYFMQMEMTKLEVTMLILHKVDFKTNSILKMTKGTI